MRIARSLLLVAAAALAPVLEAQQRTPSTFFRDATREQPARRSGPAVTLMGGVATGDGSLDMGLFASASFAWNIAGSSLDFRLDPAVGFYSGDAGPADVNRTMIGVPAALEYEFRTVGFPRPYLMGGLGLWVSRFSIDGRNSSGIDVHTSETETDLGIHLGGGLRLGSRLGVEVRIIDIDGFTTVPLMVTLRM